MVQVRAIEVIGPTPIAKTTAPRRPRLPSLEAAEKRVRAQWLDPTEVGLRDTRRSLVRAMWRARRAGAQTLRRQLRALYHQILTAQRAQDWLIGPEARATRARNVQDPAQYAREQVQALPGQSAQLAISSPGPRYQTPGPPPPPAPPLGQTHTRIVHDEFSGKNRRERERAAREAAEGYYQALRTWRVWQGKLEELPRERREGGDGRMRPVVGNWASAPYDLRTREVELPGCRSVSESALAALVNADETLSAIREGRTVATLVNPGGGWYRDKPQAVRYAQAVLTLAFNVGDLAAQEHLRNLPLAEISR
ncbi:hypothetical protein K7W42_19295 [Deinococcus sp. HMF7604]|uniref:hypothetical protein n=1 Tax=Deinococcus betulae TaxID=2873312 RepID=UPI001CCD6D07|nr:hypothetical protein [Deinococcus betulae]MBZ9752987.1 hypothetical protein [Deinococcus betulae]